AACRRAVMASATRVELAPLERALALIWRIFIASSWRRFRWCGGTVLRRHARRKSSKRIKSTHFWNNRSARMAVTADDLILFAQVIDAGSFSRAAERAGLPKSTVSRRISALEAALGERLLTRTTRQLKITEFGEGILDHAQRLLEELEGARALAQHRQATPQGVLRASLPPDFFLDLDLLPFLIEFAERYPAVELELDLSPRRVDLIAERFDLAIRIAARLPDDSTLVARRLAVIEHGLYASCAYLARAGVPQTPDDLLQHTGLRLITSSGEAQPWLLSRGDDRWEGRP